MRNQEFEDCMAEILRSYSNQQYQMLSGDRYFKNVPDAIMRLWYSDGKQSFAICNMHAYYNRYQDGTISDAKFAAMLTGLSTALAREFAFLQQQQPQSQQTHYGAQVCTHAVSKANP